MARLLFPDESVRLAYRLIGTQINAVPGGTVLVFSDAGATTLADIEHLDNTAVAGSSLTVDAYGLIPQFQGPANGASTLYAVINGGPIVTLVATDPGQVTAAVAATLATAEAFATAAVGTETTRASAAEATNATAIATETTNRVSAVSAAITTAESFATSAVAAEATARATAITSAITALINGAPGALDTLNELAAALGNDANLAADLTASIALKAPLASPALTGAPTAPTATALDNSTKVATTAYADSAVAVEVAARTAAVALKAPLASPALTGTPTAPTAAALDATTKVATTAYADAATAVEKARALAAEALLAPLASPALTGNPTVPTQSAGNNSTRAASTAYADAAVATQHTADSGTYVQLAPVASADTSGATDQAAIMAALTTGLKVKLRDNATYYVTGLVIDTQQAIEVPETTTLKLANGSNQHLIRSKNFETFVPARLSAALAHGVAVTSIPCTPLTHAVVASDVLKFGSEYTAQTATVSGSAAIGATAIPVTSFTPSGTDDFPIGTSIKLNVTDFSTAPQGFSISIKGTLDGNLANNTIGCGVAIFGYGYTFDAPGVIYKAPEIGFYSTGVKGITGTYPGGQVECKIGVVRVAQCGLANIRYEGPHDGHFNTLISRDSGGAIAGNGVELENINGEYVHSYGKVQGVVLGAGGYVRVAHVESENSTHENLVTAFTNPSSENWIGRLTSYTAWTSGTATAANFGVLLNNATHIGKIDAVTTNGESGVYVQGKGTTIGGGKILGNRTASTFGLSVNADDVNITVKVDSWATGWKRFSKNGHFDIVGTNCSTAGYADVDSSNNGNIIDFSYLQTASESGWTSVPASNNTYRLSAVNSGTGLLVATYERTVEGFDSRSALKLAAREVASGESSVGQELCTGAIALSSQECRFAFWVASKTETIANIRGVTSTVAAGATPTLCRMGMWSVDASGNLTLVAACATDTTLFAAANTAYTRALASPTTYAKVAGQLYCTAYLVVTGAALPTIPGANFNGAGSEGLILPMHGARIASQSDLPATVAVGSLLTSGQRPYMVVTP